MEGTQYHMTTARVMFQVYPKVCKTVAAAHQGT